jgi:toxin YoeB
VNYTFSPKGAEHYQYWLATNNKSIVKKINGLVRDIQEHPFTCLGKPEQLNGNFSGYWSRRITREHRLVYKIENDIIIIAQCRFHY